MVSLGLPSLDVYDVNAWNNGIGYKMGDLLEALNKRFEERYPELDPLVVGLLDAYYKPEARVGWEDVHPLIAIAFRPRSGRDLAPAGIYAWKYEETLQGVLEMFLDVHLAVLSTISVMGGYSLAIEPHMDGVHTRVLITWNGKEVYSHTQPACYFDFDSAHMLEVYMQSIRDTITKNLGYSRGKGKSSED